MRQVQLKRVSQQNNPCCATIKRKQHVSQHAGHIKCCKKIPNVLQQSSAKRNEMQMEGNENTQRIDTFAILIAGKTNRVAKLLGSLCQESLVSLKKTWYRSFSGRFR